jgi:large subunit ribosomal protein L24
MAKTQAVKKQEAKTKKMNIRTGDMVLVISGEGRSKTPRKVLSVLPSEGKVVVEGVNVMKDSQKQNQGNQTEASRAGINEQNFVEKPMPIYASKVALVDPKSGERTRVRLEADKEGNKQRVAVKSGQAI